MGESSKLLRHKKRSRHSSYTLIRSIWHDWLHMSKKKKIYEVANIPNLDEVFSCVQLCLVEHSTPSIKRCRRCCGDFVRSRWSSDFRWNLVVTQRSARLTHRSSFDATVMNSNSTSWVSFTFLTYLLTHSRRSITQIESENDTTDIGMGRIRSWFVCGREFFR